MPSSEVVSLTPGHVVRFRERVWRVDAVVDGTFTATPLDGRDVYPRSFATALENVTDGSLPAPDPRRTTDATDQDLLLRAYRLSLVHGSAPIVGLQRSRAIPTEYQLVPLLMSLGRERVRLLIADDVGIGKTIEAGLILAELMARGRVRRTLVAVPWALTEQWRDALRDFFHLDATIIATDRMPALERRLLPGQSPWEAHDLCVASIDFLKIHAHQVLQYGWDRVIIDEATCALARTPRPTSPDVLAGDVILARVLVRSPELPLAVVGAGMPGADRSELLASPRLPALIAELCAQADVVIVDAPPLASGPDAATLAAAANGLLVVVGQGTTRSAELEAAAQGPGQLIGAIVNRRPHRRSRAESFAESAAEAATAATQDADSRAELEPSRQVASGRRA